MSSSDKRERPGSILDGLDAEIAAKRAPFGFLRTWGQHVDQLLELKRNYPVDFEALLRAWIAQSNGIMSDDEQEAIADFMRRID